MTLDTTQPIQTAKVIHTFCRGNKTIGKINPKKKNRPDPVNNKGSHPVGLAYNGADSRLNATPTAPLQMIGSNIECRSCHAMHFTDDLYGTNDGYLLLDTNDNNLCQSCHTYGFHNGFGCKDCHQSHNTNKNNIYMIKDIVSDSTVVFTAESGANSFADADAVYDGITGIYLLYTTGDVAAVAQTRV